MLRRFALLLLVSLALSQDARCALPGEANSQQAERSPVPIQRFVPFRTISRRIPTKDGVKLAVDIYLPENSKGPFPTILIRTPYAKALGELQNGVNIRGPVLAKPFLANGFAFVFQDCRGTGRSGGEWDPLRYEQSDGIDLVNWVKKRKWCSGRVGTFGASYCGYTQWAIAINSHEVCDTFQAMAAEVPAYSWHEVLYAGGAYRLETMLPWDALMCRPRLSQASLINIEPDSKGGRQFQLVNGDWDSLDRHVPLIRWPESQGVEIPWTTYSMKHPAHDAWWAKRDTTDKLSEVGVPNLTITGWYDPFLENSLQYVPQIRREADSGSRAQSQHLIIGPWGHLCNAASRYGRFGDDATIEYDDIMVQWYSRWLKDKANEVNHWPFVRYFVMGVNQWRSANDWPLGETRYENYFLDSEGDAQRIVGSGSLRQDAPAVRRPVDTYEYDPDNPVPTVGGDWSFRTDYGPADQREVELRADVLVYSTEVLKQPLEVTGPVKMVLYASSSALDTDWTAKLVDVDEKGIARILCEGIVRARFRQGGGDSLLEPGRIYPFEIDLGATSNVFVAGHRVRVEISSSNFPRYNRNMNTATHSVEATEGVVAEQTVYHDKTHPSHLILPVIPAKPEFRATRKPEPHTTKIRRPDIVVLEICDQSGRVIDSEVAMVMADGTARFNSVGKLFVNSKSLSEVQAIVQEKLGGQVRAKISLMDHGAR